VIVNFEYWSEFIVRIQREDARSPQVLQDWFGENRIPSLFCLRLRAKWRIGEQQEWARALQQFPIKGVAPIPEEAPLQASSLMMVLGIEISMVRVDQNSGLALILADGRKLVVEGINEEWEESWFLELPVDDPDRDQWSIICDSKGHISGRFPESRSV
jgi:hypothetical protein